MGFLFGCFRAPTAAQVCCRASCSHRGKRVAMGTHLFTPWPTLQRIGLQDTMNMIFGGTGSTGIYCK
jgi:hypothetical protein